MSLRGPAQVQVTAPARSRPRGTSAARGAMAIVALAERSGIDDGVLPECRSSCTAGSRKRGPTCSAAMSFNARGCASGTSGPTVGGVSNRCDRDPRGRASVKLPREAGARPFGQRSRSCGMGMPVLGRRRRMLHGQSGSIGDCELALSRLRCRRMQADLSSTANRSACRPSLQLLYDTGET